MFEEQIAWGVDMVRRIEAGRRLSDGELNALPPSQRVTTLEAAAWQKAIEQKLQASFEPDTFARYRVVWDLHKEELRRDEGDETSRMLNAWARIIAFMKELDSRTPKRP